MSRVSTITSRSFAYFSSGRVSVRQRRFSYLLDVHIHVALLTKTRVAVAIYTYFYTLVKANKLAV